MEHSRTWDTEELLQHHRWARSLARHLVADDATADDVAQESMIIALERAPRVVRSKGGLSAWLGTVVRNVARQRGRTEGRRARREREVASPEPVPSALEMTAFAEGQKLLLGALLSLDEESRHMVLLRYQEGLSAAEIARRLGKGGGTVRSKIKRALDQLRDELDQKHGGDRSAWHAAVAPLALGVPARRAASAAAQAKGLAAGWKFAIGAAVAAMLAMGLLSVLGPGGMFDDRKEAPVLLLPTPDESTAGADLALAPVDADSKSFSPSTVIPTRLAIDTVQGSDPIVESEPEEQKTGRIQIRFVDDAGRPIAGVEVTAWRGEPVIAGADGRAEIDVFLGRKSDQVSLHLYHPGYAADAVSVHGTRGETHDAGDHVLRPGGDIHGRVIDGDGNPLAGMIVSTSGLQRRGASGGGMTSYTSTQLGSTEDTTDEEGRFQLRGVLVGEIDVQAASEDEIWTGVAESVEVRAGAVVQDLVITAEEVPLGTRIQGVVLDQTGQPAPYARIRMEWKKFFSNSSRTSTASAEGRFVEVVPAGVSVDMWFRSRDDAIPRAFRGGVDAGTLDMEVRLAPPRKLTVIVTQGSGAPLADAQVWLTARGTSSDSGVTDAHGRADLARPLDEFTLVVRAEGHAEFREDYRRLSAERTDDMALPVELMPIPRLEGTVRTAAGEAVEGASVSVRALASQKVEIAGLPSLVEESAEVSGTTDVDGNFALTLRESGRFMLRAEAEGHAPAEFGPFRYSPADGLVDVKLTLSAGGTVEGRVIDGDLVRQRHVVLLSRGDGLVRTVRTSVEGDYRFEHVTPGPCFLRVVPEMISSGYASSTSSWGRPYTSIDGDVRVAEGAVTRFDLAVGEGLPPVVVRGRLALRGLDPARFRASLVPAASHLDAGLDVTPVRVGSDGAFLLRGGKPGRYRLLLVDGEAKVDADALRIAATLDLAVGTQDWELSMGVGRVTTGPGANPDSEALLWRGSAGEFAVRPLPRVGESCDFPSGTVHRIPLVALMMAGELLDLDRIEVLESVELDAGKSVVLGQ